MSGTEAHTLALVAVAATVTLWGFSSVVAKVASTTGLITSFYRLWFAIPLVWLIPIVAPSIRRRLDRDWLTASLAGGILFGLHQVLFFSSLKLTTVANVTIIGALQPALVLLVAGRMFGERVRYGAILWSLVALGGTVSVVVGSAETRSWSPVGDGFAVANLFAFTAYFLVSKQIRSRIRAPEYVIGMTTVAGGVVLVASLAAGQDFGAPQGWDWLILVFLAVLPGTLGHLLTNWAHRHASAFAMSIMLLAVPVIASMAAAVLLDETLRLPQIAGGTIVLLAIGVIVRSTRAEAREQLAESAAETGAP